MRGAILGLLLCVSSPPARGEEPAPSAPADQFRTLLEDWRVFLGQVRAEYAALKTDQEKERAAEEISKREHAFFGRALEFAESHRGDPAAVDALVWVVYRGLAPERAKALERLARDHIEGPGLKPAFSYVSMRRHTQGDDFALYETLLREAMAKHPDRDIRGRACFRLGQWLHIRSEGLRRLEQFPDYYGWLQRQRGMGPEAIGRFRERRPDDLDREAERLLERTLAEFGDIRDEFYPEAKEVSLGTLGEGAEKELFELRHLSIGRVAPEIEGDDIDGEPMKLSDHRGKVVVLNFWGTWCGPCMALIPHERSLAERLAGKPFALLGVNSDADREKLKEAMERERITWRSWWDGGSQEGPIATRWNVSGWPAVYVLDARGVIRYKDVRDEELRQAVDRLLEEMAAKPGP